jgi:Zn-dependent peptidase ImmA (M78 family)
MTDRRPNAKLSAYDVREIQDKVREKLGSSQKFGQIIGTQVFTILSHHARVLQYPLGSEAPWAFVQINGDSGSKPFVVVNTSRPVDEQVFGAAHELYHIWYDLRGDIVASTDGDHDGLYDEATLRSESLANRFAAEFLAEEHTLRREMGTYAIKAKHIDVQAVLLLSSIFSVPYRTMTRRLLEIDVLSSNRFDELDVLTSEEQARLRTRYGIAYIKGDGRVSLDNLVDLSLSAYEQNRITFEKLEYLLSLNMITAEDVGVSKPKKSSMPSGEELDGVPSV